MTILVIQCIQTTRKLVLKGNATKPIACFIKFEDADCLAFPTSLTVFNPTAEEIRRASNEYFHKYGCKCERILAISTYLTRFNKIAIQGTPRMAVDKEAISVSRVYSYYSKCNLTLFYV